MSDTPTSQQALNGANTAEADGHGPRVLIVDDSELGGLLQALFARNQIEAELARTAGAALDALLHSPPDLAIVELDLPDASGVDLMHIIREPSRVPVIVIGAAPRNGLPEGVQQALETADAYFQKPLHTRQLMNFVSTLLGTDLTDRVTPYPGAPLPSADEDLGQMGPLPADLKADGFGGEESGDSSTDVDFGDLVSETPGPVDPLPPLTAPTELAAWDEAVVSPQAGVPTIPNDAIMTVPGADVTAPPVNVPAAPTVVEVPSGTLAEVILARAGADAPSVEGLPLVDAVPVAGALPLVDAVPVVEAPAPPVEVAPRVDAVAAIEPPPPVEPPSPVETAPSVEALPPVEPPSPVESEPSLERHPEPVRSIADVLEPPPLPALDVDDDRSIDIRIDLAPSDALPPLPVEPPPPVQDAAPPADPTDLMAMWMRKQEAHRSLPPSARKSAPPTTMQMSGTIGPSGLAGLLDAFYSASESGSILLKRGQAQRRIGLYKGLVAAATSNVTGEQVTDTLKALKLCDDAAVEQALASAGGRRAELLATLVKSGALTGEQARKVLVEQRDRIVRNGFAWRDATFELVFGRGPAGNEPAFTGEVILRGIMTSEPLTVLRERVPGHRTYAPRTDSIYPLERLSLSLDEARLVIANDGTKTVDDLISLSDLSEQHLRGFLLGLQTLKLIRLLPEKPLSKRVVTFF